MGCRQQHVSRYAEPYHPTSVRAENSLATVASAVAEGRRGDGQLFEKAGGREELREARLAPKSNRARLPITTQTASAG